jgi:hypothetical protein
MSGALLPTTSLFTFFLLLGLAGAAQSPRSDPSGVGFFEKQIRPILVESCYNCHSGNGKSPMGGLRLDSRALLLKGGAHGSALVPGKPEESLLLKAVGYTNKSLQMPPQGRLSAARIALLTEWVRMGAPDPRESGPPAAKPMGMSVEEGRRHWAFQPLRRVTPPLVKNDAWRRTPIDRFILAQLEAKGLKPNPEADRRTLLRRAYFDLIGLPPTPEEVQAFRNDPSPDAYEKLIDRLLASPHYGERWGRHWLDLARFAESHGYEQDYDRPYAYQYRDFVIKALNADMPYDRFVRWQLAGDEVAPDDPMALMATGFLAAGTHATQITKNQVEKERYDELDDMLSTTSTTFLGLTIGCARCHNHKYDPIPNRDYYRMLSTFTTTVRSEMDVNMDPEGYRQAKAAFDTAHAPLITDLRRYERAQLPQRMDQWLKARGYRITDKDRTALLAWYRTLDPEWQRLNGLVQSHLTKAPPVPNQKVLICSEGVPAVRTHTQGGDFLEQTYFLKRGDPNNKDGVATQSFLQVLMRTPDGEKRWQAAPPKDWRTSYRRRSLANWITDTDDGAGRLLARVIVNRLWQHHMGRGIVATPSDFGTQGERPTHPDLLDWLATELIRNGWHLKPIHKLMMMSAVYRQSDASHPTAARLDPNNRLCWRHPRQRLEAEVIRDSMLAVSGTLDTTMYGPGTLDEKQRRRSIYFFVKRSRLIPAMMLFDAPNALQSIALRASTTVAPQALMLMNSPMVRECAQSLARRAAPAKAVSFLDALPAAYRIALGRAPTEQERADALLFLNRQAASYQAAGHADAARMALEDFCQVLLGLNEFLYID